ncbi:predicted protein [Naegleria gruberi]|uniref:Predicted protein n=1 Tax=Naegleria gruberi TaxID=5762 RepID=D2VFP0_NAEGR|nr:uncharacterized protein NAEGRDRAFT_79790 [Naegleria gruberi]EFC44392.1 predicted protein [Naegleria gruberi]|eukprot:XP_002677136.1 predicted protein [Naegleria gruberi strain NEG-M]
MMTVEGLFAIFDVALFTLKEMDFHYRPLAMDDSNLDSLQYSLTQQLDQSMNFLSNTTFKNTQKLSPKSVMFVYTIGDELPDYDDASSESSLESDSSDANIRTGFTGIIDFEKNEMTIYPPSNSSCMNKDSVINLMDMADCLGISTLYMCIEKNHQEIREFSRGFIYAGFELIQPKIKQLSSTEWVVFGAEL